MTDFLQVIEKYYTAIFYLAGSVIIIMLGVFRKIRERIKRLG